MSLKLTSEQRAALGAHPPGQPVEVVDDETKRVFWLIAPQDMPVLWAEHIEREIQLGLDAIDRGELVEWNPETLQDRARPNRTGFQPRLMSTGYRLSSMAHADVTAIIDRIAEDDLEAALRMIDRFTSKFELIANTPGLGEICGDPSRRLRRTIVGKYLVFYQAHENEVAIVRVLHGARNWETLI